MTSCCELGEEFERGENVLHETDNFFVMATLGPIKISGYLLIVSKDHFTGVGDIPEQEHKELESLMKDTRGIVKEVYDRKAMIFEHGPRVCGFTGGGCLDHAHLHVVPGIDIIDPLALDLMRRLQETTKFYRVDRIEGFKRVADIYHQRNSSYLFAESPDLRRIVTEINFPLPSQYARRLTAEQLGIDIWDWRKYPDLNTRKRTVEMLRGKF